MDQNLLNVKILGVILGVLLILINDSHGDRMRAGYTYPLKIESDDNEHSQITPERDYHNDIGKDGKMWKLQYEGVSYVAVHFKCFNLRTGEYLSISDATGKQNYIIEGEGRKGTNGKFWAPHIKGDTMMIELISDFKNHTSNVFEIDEVGLGDPSISWENTPRQLRGSVVEDYAGYYHARKLDNCGVNDRRNAICYKDEFPEHYETAKAVARLLIQEFDFIMLKLFNGQTTGSHNI